MDAKLKKIKDEVLGKLGKLKTKQGEVDNIISDIENKVTEMNGEKPLKTDYGTSCVHIQNKKGKILAEY